MVPMPSLPFHLPGVPMRKTTSCRNSFVQSLAPTTLTRAPGYVLSYSPRHAKGLWHWRRHQFNHRFKIHRCHRMVIGANPTDAHPVTGAKLKQFAMKGKTTIVIDPRRTELARYATHHIQLKPGTNVVLLNMMLYCHYRRPGRPDLHRKQNRGYDEFKQQNSKPQHRRIRAGYRCRSQ